MLGRAFRFVLLVSALVLWAAPGAAQGSVHDDPLAGLSRLERDALVRTVLERNPDIEAARQAWRAAAARPAQAGALEDPMLSYGVAPLSIASGDVGFGQELRVEQRIPDPGRRSLRRTQARAEVDAAVSDYHAAVLELSAMAALLFEDYRLVYRAAEINQEHLRLLQDFREVAAGRYAAGLASQQDPIQAEVESVELLQREVELTAERQGLEARLNALLHRRPGLPLPPPSGSVPGPQPADPLDPEALEEAAIAARPEMARRLAELRSLQLGVELARRERRPDFGVMGSYNSMWMDAEHRWMAGVSVNLPVWRSRIAAAEAEAEARLAQAESEREHLEIEIRAEVREKLARLGEAQQRIALFEDRLLPAVRDFIQAARAAFETGQSSFLNVIEAERGLRRAQLGYEQALADRRRREVELDRAVGRLPDGSRPDSPDRSNPAAEPAARGGAR